MWAPILALAGVTERRSTVEVGSDRLTARFGVFRVDTALGNVADVTVHDGPFNPLKALGVRYSFADRSVTFGSSTGPMVEVGFRRPVALDPPGLTRHPALWLSVADPEGLRQALSPSRPEDLRKA